MVTRLAENHKGNPAKKPLENPWHGEGFMYNSYARKVERLFIPINAIESYIIYRSSSLDLFCLGKDVLLLSVKS